MQKKIKQSILATFAVLIFCQITYSQRTYGGIGAIINIDTICRFPFIVEVKKGMPAEKMNLATNDFITRINGQSTYNYTLEQAISQVRGPVGTICSITILRNNIEYPFTFTRIAISEDSDEFAFSPLRVHSSSCEIPEARKVDGESEAFKLSKSFLQESIEKPERKEKFMKLAIKTCNDNLEARLSYAEYLKKRKDFFMRNHVPVTGPSYPEQSVYNPKNWQHFISAKEDAYGYVFEQYDSVLAIDPKHLKARLNVADIYYFNGQFEDCAKQLKLLVCAIPREQHNSDVCTQARRMMRRCEWLISLPKNSIKLNTLYWDKGRAETFLYTLGTVGMTAGEIYSKSTGKLSGALIGAGFNAVTMLIQKSKESLKWFDKAVVSHDSVKLYTECLEHLPQKINTTGFYSYETMLMLSGIIYAGKKLRKKNAELRDNAQALVDIIQIANPEINTDFTMNKFIIRQGLEAALTLSKYDETLLIYDELNLYNFLIEFNNRLKSVGDQSYFSEKSVEIFEKRLSLLSELIDSLGNPKQKEEINEKFKKDKLQKQINAALATLNDKPYDIETRSILAMSYEEKEDYNSAIIQYEHLLEYYKQKKNTNKIQEINMHLKACKLLIEKN